MLPLEVRKYLFDIAQASDLLTQFTGGKTFTDYSADALLRLTVERQFEVVGKRLIRPSACTLPLPIVLATAAGSSPSATG